MSHLTRSTSRESTSTPKLGLPGPSVHEPGARHTHDTYTCVRAYIGTHAYAVGFTDMRVTHTRKALGKPPNGYVYARKALGMPLGAKTGAWKALGRPLLTRARVTEDGPKGKSPHSEKCRLLSLLFRRLYQRRRRARRLNSAATPIIPRASKVAASSSRRSRRLIRPPSSTCGPGGAGTSSTPDPAPTSSSPWDAAGA